MLDIIAANYPRLVRAMRKRWGMSKDETARLIMAARYGSRAGAWTVTDCARARHLIAGAIVARRAARGF